MKLQSISLLILMMSLALTTISAQESTTPTTRSKSATKEYVKQDIPKGGAVAPKKSKSLWKTLAKITYKKKFDELMGLKIDIPVFSNQIKELEGKEVNVKGYIIPVEGYKSHKEFIFSAFPYNMCFFCGGAGPETVMEVIATDGVEYTAEQVVLKGKLSLNDEDINHLMYLLTDAVIVE